MRDSNLSPGAARGATFRIHSGNHSHAWDCLSLGTSCVAQDRRGVLSRGYRTTCSWTIGHGHRRSWSEIDGRLPVVAALLLRDDFLHVFPVVDQAPLAR